VVKELLEFYLKYFDFLYLDSRYRLSDSKTDGVNASLTVTGPNLTWSIVNDRGQIQLAIVPTNMPGNGFWISLIKQYLSGSEDIHYLSAVEEIEWARVNIRRIDELFSVTSDLESTCGTLRALMRSNAEKQWGPAATS
jgi:hypothetical protein